MKIFENYRLDNLNTFRTGGKARFFCIIKSVDDLKKAIDFTKKKKLKNFVLGGGSNILISDEGFDGLVIKNEILGKSVIASETKQSKVSGTGLLRDYSRKDEDGEREIVCFGSGENWDKCVLSSIKNNLFGLENLSYIPGTAGASPVQNIGAYGVEAKDFIFKVEVFDTESGEVFEMKNKECKFSYRNSIFKVKKNLIVTKVYFALNKKFKPVLTYGGVKEKLEETRARISPTQSALKRPKSGQGRFKALCSGELLSEVTATDVRNAVILIRKSKLPEVSELGSAGSFFKNPVIEKEKFEKIKNKYTDIKFFEENNKIKIALGFVLDKICGLKGFRKGNVGFYEKQPLVIVNYGNANTKEILALAEIAKNKIKEKIGIKIEMEVEKK